MRAAALLRSLGPIAIVVLLVPGGSLIALAFGLYRSLQSREVIAPLQPAFLRSRSSLKESLI